MFKILCLDGGGARGYFTAYILKRIEEEFKIKLSDYFDLIVGTSTGSIIAASIAVGVDVNDLLDLYKYKNEYIFEKNGTLNIGMISSLYTNKNLKKEIKRTLDGRDFIDAHTNLMIQATDIENKMPKIFRSWYIKQGESLMDAMLASSAAPIYFDPYYVNNKYYSDGCLWANNPTVVAISEALSKDSFNKKIDEIKILSIGTGIDTRKIDFSNQRNWGLMTWAKDLINIMISCSDISDEMVSKKLLNEKYLRIDYLLNEEISINKIPNYVLEESENIFNSYKEKISEFIKLDNKKDNLVISRNEKKYNLVQKVAKYIFKI